MRTRLTRAWTRLPLLLGLALLYVPLILWLASQVPAWRAPIQALDGGPLIGMNAPTAPAEPWRAAWTGEWQRYADARFNELLPLRRPAVRATNQLYYSVFRSSYMLNGSMVPARHGQLMEREYIADYCNFPGTRFDDAQFDAWAAQVARVRDQVQARGQAFMYVISAAKPAILPSEIPSRMPCPAADQARPRYRAALAALDRAGVRYIDGSARVLQARQTVPSADLFPRGGTHWTLFAASLATAPLLDAIRYADGGTPSPLRVQVKPDGPLGGVDTDLLDLANLWRRDASYTVPAVTVEPAQPPGRPRSLAIVGGSFANQIMELLAANGQFSRMDYYYYLTTAHLTYPGRVHQPTDAPDVYDALFKADVVLLEENEIKMPSPHVEQLEAVLKRGPRQ